MKIVIKRAGSTENPIEVEIETLGQLKSLLGGNNIQMGTCGMLLSAVSPVDLSILLLNDAQFEGARQSVFKSK